MTRAAGGSLDPRGPVAEAIADLWWLMLGLGAVVFVAFAALLVVGLFRRSAENQDRAHSQQRVRRWIVGGGVVLPLIVLIVVFGATVYAMRVIPTAPPSSALVVEIVGRQWQYEVSYPQEGVAAVNELHLPVGRPVALHLTSTDVIHSFWVPELGGKLDLLPDDTNILVLQADEPGTYRARCAEFCGLQHARMKLVVVAEQPDAFASWLDGQR